MIGIPRRIVQLFHHGRGWLILDQAASGAGNALPLLLASMRLNGPELIALSLAFLLLTTSIALHRALLLDPTLSVIGGVRVRWHRLFVGLLFAIGFAVVVSSVAVLLEVATDVVQISVFAFAVAGACFHDFLRYRSLHVGAQKRAFYADGSWAIVAISGVLLGPPTWTFILLCWGAGALVSMGFLIFRAVGEYQDKLLRETLRRGRYQFMESGVTSLLTVVPMFIGVALGWDARIAAIRLAQSAFGPLNSIHGAVTLAVMTRSQEIIARPPGEVSSIHARLQRAVLFTAVIYSAVAIFALFIIPVEEPLVASSVPIATAVVGVGIVLTSIASPSIVLLRAYGKQNWVLYGRAVIIMAAAVITVIAIVAFPDVVDPASSMIVSSALIGVVVWQLLRVKAMGESRD